MYSLILKAHDCELLKKEILITTKKLHLKLKMMKRRDRILSKQQKQKALIAVVLLIIYLCSVITALTKIINEIKESLFWGGSVKIDKSESVFNIPNYKTPQFLLDYKP